MGAVLSFGQDARWRRFMVSKVNAIPGSWALDVASGTGLVSRELAARKDVRVAALDQSEQMLRTGREPTRLAGLEGQVAPVLGEAERLPFRKETFDSVTFTYLLRYVDDPQATLIELTRVLRRGGTLACVEFHVPENPGLRLGWRVYTHGVMPLLGAVVSTAWRRTGAFLGPNVESFWRRAPLPEQVRMWQSAGVRHIRTRVMSFGTGIVIWGVKGEPPAGG